VVLKKKRCDGDRSVYAVDIGLAGVLKRFGAHAYDIRMPNCRDNILFFRIFSSDH